MTAGAVLMEQLIVQKARGEKGCKESLCWESAVEGKERKKWEKHIYFACMSYCNIAVII